MLKNPGLKEYEVKFPDNVYQVGKRVLVENNDNENRVTVTIFLDCYPNGLENGMRPESSVYVLENVSANPAKSDYLNLWQAQHGDKYLDGIQIKNYVPVIQQ